MDRRPPKKYGALCAPPVKLNSWNTRRKEGGPMASDGRNNQGSYLYLGLAGETGPGRAVHTGLCRLADGSDEWELLQRGLPEAPAARAIAAPPLKPESVHARTHCRTHPSAHHRHAMVTGGTAQSSPPVM